MLDLGLGRRGFLASGLAGAGVAALPTIAFAAAPTERRFVFIIQRGAADGLGIVMPTGDPGFAAARGSLAMPGGTRLDGMFTLHPALTETAKMFGEKQALFAHAVASRYRDRSHFDGQNVLETGGTRPYQFKDGWLNRFLALLPRTEADAIAISSTIPAALRGKVEVASYAPSALPDAPDDLLVRVSAMYAADPQLHGLWEQAMATRAMTGDLSDASGKNAAATGALAARLLMGPRTRIAMIETGGWDTHAGQQGRLNAQLKGLDAMLAALKTGLGPQWANTLVVVATEFGRTVAVNGTAGPTTAPARRRCCSVGEWQAGAWLRTGRAIGGKSVRRARPETDAQPRHADRVGAGAALRPGSGAGARRAVPRRERREVRRDFGAHLMRDDEMIDTPDGPMTWAAWKKKNPVQIPSRRTKGKDLPNKVKRFTEPKG